MLIEVNTDIVMNVYGPETLISEHTNQPVKDDAKKIPIFWCDVCHLKINTAHRAILHLGGKFHRGRKSKSAIQNSLVVSSKRKVFVDAGGKQNDGFSPSKKIKVDVSDSSLNCEDCDLQFNSSAMAIQHFKGKKHALKVAAKVEAKKNKWQQGNVTGLVNQRGRGRVDRGRADVVRGSGIISNIAGMGGIGSGQLLRVIKDLYDQTPGAPLSAPRMWNNSGHRDESFVRHGAGSNYWYRNSGLRDISLRHQNSFTYERARKDTLVSGERYW